MRVARPLTEAELPEVNPFDPAFVADPDTVYVKVHESGPVASCPFGGLVVGHQALRTVLHDELLVGPKDALLAMFGITGGAYAEWFSSMLVNRDGAEHSRLRRLVAAAFTARRADANRPMMRALAEEMLDPIVEAGGGDAVELTSALPIRVFCRMIGVPEADVRRFVRWAASMGKVYDMNVGEAIGELDAALTGLRAYVEELLDRRAQSGDASGLVGELLAASDDGERLTRAEVVSLVILLLGAGYDTTSNELAWGIYALSTTAGLPTRLAETPSDVPRFVEELLRRYTSAASTGRIATADVELGDLLVPAGSYLMVSYHAAGLDPTVYEDPLRFDIDRAPTEPLLSFGWGPHYCLGAHLARAELQEFFWAFTARVGAVRLAGEPELGSPLGIRSVLRLPVVVEPRE